MRLPITALIITSAWLVSAAPIESTAVHAVKRVSDSQLSPSIDGFITQRKRDADADADAEALEMPRSPTPRLAPPSDAYLMEDA